MPTSCPPLSSPWQACFAALLGGPFAGLWLVSYNFKTIGWDRKALNLRIAILGLFIAFVAIAVHGPEIKGSTTVLAALLAVAVREYARWSYGNTYQKHIAEGGLRASHWRWILTGIFGLVVTFGAAVAYAYLLSVVAPGLLPERFLN